MKILRTASLALWALGLSLAARAQAPAPALATFPVGTTTVTASALAGNLATIWELAWGPDNFIWMTERAGRISRVNPATGQVSLLLAGPDVTESNESGLLGMAIDAAPTGLPAGSYWVFVAYNYTDQGTLKEKLVRYTYANGALTSPLVWLGLVLYGMSAVLWLWVLSRLPVSLAYPLVSLGFVVTMGVGVVWLDEPFSWVRVAACTLIVAGVTLLALDA